MVKRIIFLLVLLLILSGGIVFFFRQGNRTTSYSNKLNVVTTFEPLYVFAVNVAGNTATVENLLPQGSDPHDYAFTPRDIERVSKADVVIKQGLGIDAWLDGLLNAAGRKHLRLVVASEGIKPHTGAPTIDIGKGFSNPPQTNSLLVMPDINDPHTWLDPYLAIQMVQNIRDGLMSADPSHADVYAKNTESYLLKLIALDGEIRSLMNGIANPSFIAFHPAFRYFAYEYSLQEVGAVEETPGHDPSPRELAELVSAFVSNRTRLIFSEPQFSPKIVEALARDYHLTVLPVDSLETGQLTPDYYEIVMRQNATHIAEALRAQ